MTPLRLLAVLEAYSITGPAKNLLEFARLGREAGVLTTVATYTRDSQDNHFIATARLAGIPVEVIAEQGPYDPATVRKLREIVARVQPHILQTHAVKSHFITRRMGLPEHIPWVAFHHGYTWPTLKARLYNQLDRWSLRAADKVLTVSRPFERELLSRGVKPDRIEIVHNAIPLDWGARARKPEEAAGVRAQLGIGIDSKVILIVGRLSREKDHLTLLEAVSRLPSSIKAQLLIVGDGPERSRIDEHIRRLNLGTRVTFTGHQSSAESYYGIADVAVLSSLSEGSPNALLEAMVTEVPVVATAVGGIPEILTHGESGLLVQPGEVEQMSTAISLLLTNPDLASRMTGRARIIVRDRHSPDARMGKLLEIYHAMRSAKITSM